MRTALILGIILIIIGSISIINKQFSMDFGRYGFFKPKPVVNFKLTGDRSKLFGVVTLLGGLVLVGTCIYIFVTKNYNLVDHGFLIVLTIIDLFFIFFVFVFELFVEFFVNIKENKKK